MARSQDEYINSQSRVKKNFSFVTSMNVAVKLYFRTSTTKIAKKML